MSATNKTAVYELPIFLGTDVPSWLTDWNGAMGDIDTAIAAAKAAADAAASTAGTAATDIVTINGQITSLKNTVGTHTTQIGTISGSINTINSLIGNGTPTTTDQTIIGAINELHADQGDLADLTTTDKSSLVAAINEAAQGGGGGTAASVSYNNTESGITATNVQDAIDEIAQAGGSPAVTSTMTDPSGITLTSNYVLKKDDVVYIQGTAVLGTEGNVANVNLGTLASGFRPGSSVNTGEFVGVNATGFRDMGRLEIGTDGTVVAKAVLSQTVTQVIFTAMFKI